MPVQEQLAVGLVPAPTNNNVTVAGLVMAGSVAAVAAVAYIAHKATKYSKIYA